MTDFSGLALEQSVDNGWEQFEEWLAGAIADMADGDVVIVARESVAQNAPDAARAQEPFVQFLAVADGWVRGEASGNRQLTRSS
jgi:T3SS (YopN, CesT) and YbjN peptide-binding chaperone 3